MPHAARYTPMYDSVALRDAIKMMYPASPTSEHALPRAVSGRANGKRVDVHVDQAALAVAVGDEADDTRNDTRKCVYGYGEEVRRRSSEP